MFVKKFIRKDRRYIILKSINPDYDDIEIDLKEIESEDEFKIIAIVIDWKTPVKPEQIL